MRPTWRFAGAVVLWLAIEWYGTTSQVPWLFLLAAWLAALAVLALAYAAWNRAGLGLRLEVAATHPAEGSPVEDLPASLVASGPSPAPIFEGDGMDVEVRLTTSGAPRGPAWAHGEVGGTAVDVATGLVPRGGWARRHAVAALRRGPVGASSWVVGSGDPLGLFGGTRAQPDAEVALVLPKLTSFARRRPARELEAAVVAPRAGAGSELIGIREYRPGDSLRRIHWRSSARRGELVVREFEPPGLQVVGIYCDPSPPTREAADQVARIAASEAWDCIRGGGRAYVWSPGLAPTDRSQARDLWALLDWLARYPSGSPDRSDPPPSAEVVIVAAGHSEALAGVAEEAAARGVHVRAWAVGASPVELDCPVERVGLEWPL